MLAIPQIRIQLEGTLRALADYMDETSMTIKLCWNAIVKNESARIVRCMESLVPYISCAVVVDTGSK